MKHVSVAEFLASRGKKKAPKKRKKIPTLREIQIRAQSYPYGPDDSPSGPGELLAFFYLPTELCKRQNEKFGAERWQAKSDRVKCFRYMLPQLARIYSAPATGRPLVRCTRYSSVEPDKFSDWAKVPVDCLCRKTERAKHRLGIIYDDAPKHAEIEQLWRKAKPGESFVLIEVWGNQ